jgi:hypothetical protein
MSSDFNQLVKLEGGKPVTDLEEAYIMCVAITRAHEIVPLRGMRRYHFRLCVCEDGSCPEEGFQAIVKARRSCARRVSHRALEAKRTGKSTLFIIQKTQKAEMASMWNRQTLYDATQHEIADHLNGLTAMDARALSALGVVVQFQTRSGPIDRYQLTGCEQSYVRSSQVWTAKADIGGYRIGHRDVLNRFAAW